MHKESVEVSFIVNGVIMKEIVEAINKLGETSWMDYVQLGATVVGIIISALAVIYAVKGPKKIAEEQNDIALFDKRAKFYFDFCRCISFCEGLDTVETSGGARMIFYTMFSNESIECEIDDVDKRITPLQMRMTSDLFTGNYLFGVDVDKYLEPVVKGIVNILSAKTDENFKKCREQLKKDGAEAKRKLTKKLEASLKLTK